jgi:hypothetical protein
VSGEVEYLDEAAPDIDDEVQGDNGDKSPSSGHASSADQKAGRILPENELTLGNRSTVLLWTTLFADDK